MLTLKYFKFLQKSIFIMKTTISVEQRFSQSQSLPKKKSSSKRKSSLLMRMMRRKL